MAFYGKVTERFAGVSIGDDGAYRDRDVHIVAAMPGAIVAAAALAVLAFVGAGNAKIGESIHALDGFEVDAAAKPPVTPVGTAERRELLAAEAHATATAVARRYFQLGFVDEFHDIGRC